MAKWHQLIKTGKYKDRHGTEHLITGEILDRVVANYDPDKPAHIIVGHPDKKVVPSFGLVEKLKRVGDVLFFKPGKVVAEFATLVRKGAFPDVSAGFDQGFNSLNHVALLSAQSPACPGLEPLCEFSAPGSNDGKESVVSVDIVEVFGKDLPQFAMSSEEWLVWRTKDIGRVLRNLKNYLIEKESQEKADELMSEWLLESLTQDPPEYKPEFSTEENGDTTDFEQEYKTLLPRFESASARLAEFTTQVSTLSTANTQLKDENAALQVKLQKLETDARLAEFSAFVETLIGEGRVLPDQKQFEVEQLELMHQATPPEFSSGSGEKSPVDKYKASLQVRPVIVPAGEVKTPEFSAGAADAVSVGKRARAYIDEQAEKGITVSTVEAVRHVRGEAV